MARNRVERSVQICLLLGPAGSGKTYRCLTQIAAALRQNPDGAPLFLLAPKQTTYQLERQLLGEHQAGGYTRLHVLSPERFARLTFTMLGQTPPPTLDEEGRLMVLRSMLSAEASKLQIFRSSARLSGFAQQLSATLRELQSSLATPATLRAVAEKCGSDAGLCSKLKDLAMLLESYDSWVTAHGLKDSDYLMQAAADALRQSDPKDFAPAGVWVDGFNEWTARELDLLSALIKRSREVTITFSLEAIPGEREHWLSQWSPAREAYKACAKMCQSTGGAVRTEVLARDAQKSRYSASPMLRELEQHWPLPQQVDDISGLKLACCDDPGSEVRYAARRIRRHARAGGRYRDVAVLVRNLELFHEDVHRVFTQFQIPFFTDRRESISHHPLLELTRSALRMAAFDWQHEDFFALLKSGLARMDRQEVDALENAALEKGWQRSDWTGEGKKPTPDLAYITERLKKHVVEPMVSFARAVNGESGVTGLGIAAAIRALWRAFGAEQQLQDWSALTQTGREDQKQSVMHATAWVRANKWLENVELAFPSAALSLRDWLPIADAGLRSLTIGLIPPVLDQVTVGAVPRSRNPQARLVIVMGCNEGSFPTPSPPPSLLTDSDRCELERFELQPGSTLRRHLAREQYFAYVACTRATEELVLTWSRANAEGSKTNPSPFISHLRRALPGVEVENFCPQTIPLEDCEHELELFIPSLQLLDPFALAEAAEKSGLVLLKEVLERHRANAQDLSQTRLPPAVARQMYGSALHTSVSRLEEFAACPFKFFLQAGLRAKERRLYEADSREQGSLQHNVLAEFHNELVKAGRRWRSLSPGEARTRIEEAAQKVVARFRGGMFDTEGKTGFIARMLVKRLQNFAATTVEWMQQHYRFDPMWVELDFGPNMQLPEHAIELGDGARLVIQGRIDRVDLATDPETGSAHFVVIDYKNSGNALMAIRLENGLQLQLLTYAIVLQHCRANHPLPAGTELFPAGVFYVSLKEKPVSCGNRREANEKTRQPSNFKHSGRFNLESMHLLGAGCDSGKEQFNARFKKDGGIYANCHDPLPGDSYESLLALARTNLTQMGRRILDGEIALSPYKLKSEKACQFCDYSAICRIDAWTHQWRVLRAEMAQDEEE